MDAPVKRANLSAQTGARAQTGDCGDFTGTGRTPKQGEKGKKVHVEERPDPDSRCAGKYGSNRRGGGGVGTYQYECVVNAPPTASHLHRCFRYRTGPDSPETAERKCGCQAAASPPPSAVEP